MKPIIKCIKKLNFKHIIDKYKLLLLLILLLSDIYTLDILKSLNIVKHHNVLNNIVYTPKLIFS